MYKMGVLKKKKFELGKILSTVDALTQHLKRIYLQVQYWIYGEENCSLDPTDWGWKKVGDTLVPIKMTKEAAPAHILSSIFCGCKKGCTRTCSCRKNGLLCTIACRACQGVECTNNSYSAAEIDDENEIDENDDVDENEINGFL